MSISERSPQTKPLRCQTCSGKTEFQGLFFKPKYDIDWTRNTRIPKGGIAEYIYLYPNLLDANFQTMFPNQTLFGTNFQRCLGNKYTVYLLSVELGLNCFRVLAWNWTVQHSQKSPKVGRGWISNSLYTSSKQAFWMPKTKHQRTQIKSKSSILLVHSGNIWVQRRVAAIEYRNSTCLETYFGLALMASCFERRTKSSSR